MDKILIQITGFMIIAFIAFLIAKFIILKYGFKKKERIEEEMDEKWAINFRWVGPIASKALVLYAVEWIFLIALKMDLNGFIIATIICLPVNLILAWVIEDSRKSIEE